MWLKKLWKINLIQDWVINKEQTEYVKQNGLSNKCVWASSEKEAEEEFKKYGIWRNSIVRSFSPRKSASFGTSIEDSSECIITAEKSLFYLSAHAAKYANVLNILSGAIRHDSPILKYGV